MSLPRYALRSAAFAAVFLTAALTLGAPLAVAALWLTAQHRYAHRRHDVVMLATAAMVWATLEGAGLLMSAVVAVATVVPALLYAVLLQRWLPGYWLGHGDRFRRPRAALGRLAASAALAAGAAAVLSAVIDTAFSPLTAALFLAGNTAALMLAPLAVRAARRSREPRRAALSVVR
ncbi:hypothetical protein [Actinoplanes sp. NPDC049802]|uniref:hypothetical protein n=1 Tax=Actinoplanes sp. NPDC049802 TaxID=3154742 RepID=UPI0033D81DB7